MDRSRRKTERLRPELAPGGTVDALSFPQQVEIREPVAVQKHQPRPAAAQAKTFPCDMSLQNDCEV